MRIAVVALLSVSCVSALAGQATPFTHAAYLAPQYLAPEDAPSVIVVAGKDEPGERLVVTGRTLDGNRAVAGVSLYVFHTDATGRYAPGLDPDAGELNPRLHGVLRTDSEGRYQFETSRPGSYENGPAHVHYVVSARGYEPLLLALQFEDDPIVVGRKKFGTFVVDADAFKNGPCQARPDCILTQPVRRDAEGVAHVIRDIQMVKR
jgi:protocatechuate 3,4-dioxygenase beta subunit